MGYIILREGRVPGDPKWNFWGTIILFVWIFGLLLMPDSDSTFWKILHIVWIAVPLIVIGLFIIYCVVGVIIVQLNSRFPDRYEKLPKWVKELSEKYIL